MPAQKATTNPSSKTDTVQVIIVRHKGAVKNIGYTQQNDATDKDKSELASTIIDDAVTQLQANLDAVRHQYADPVFFSDDAINNIGLILTTPIMQFLHHVPVQGTKLLNVKVLQGLPFGRGVTECQMIVVDNLGQKHLVEISLERQFMAKDGSKPRPVRIQIRPHGLRAYSMADTGLINPEPLGSLELASDISKMVAFYVRHAIEDAGKAQGHRGVHASVEELSFHMDSFADDIYAFAKDSTSTALSINIAAHNNRNEISKVRVDIERTREWRNPT